ncbi:hypothetical protein [Cognatilysobacter bugurensis]|uniref:Uncharacterized protein n=1 Tax=Cognatilysobacter bugurensis TaxID=543356 RepID=A0A918W936_9GAMM|nr:hypothetical protein [Lysobacter bugurensis]GHA88420.1 hypothetical protein GCM10007067_28070 [Lysobacter bugurensis]
MTPRRPPPRTLSAALGADGSAARLLAAALVALVVMIAASLMVQIVGATLAREVATPIGALSLADVLTAFVAMAAGGLLARSARFRIVAVVLQAVVWISIVAALYLAPGGSVASPLPLGEVLRHNALAFVASLLAAGLGAWAGERLARRRAAAGR